MSAPESGAATAEYTVVLIAATAFAGVLLAVLKSGAVRELLSDLIRRALSVSLSGKGKKKLLAAVLPLS